MTACYLRDYDLQAARTRVHARVDRERGLAFDGKQLDYQPNEYLTHTIRDSYAYSLEIADKRLAPISQVRWRLVYALELLPVWLGGAVQAVPGGYAALPSNLHPGMPLVRALMIARAHPTHGPFDRVNFERPEQPASVPASDIGPLLESMFVAAPQVWDQAELQRTILEGAKSALGDLEIESTWDPDHVWLGDWGRPSLSPLTTALVLEAAGALEPGYTRQDALVGEWWLLQPTSPNIDFYQLARRLDLECMGVMPAAHVDVPGRLVMMCYVRSGMGEQQRIAEIEDSKWIRGWRKVVWGRREGPLADPTFDVIEERDRSPDQYVHSSELPPWP